MTTENKALMKSLEWVIDIDPPAIIASVAAERKEKPDASNKKLAEEAFSRARWKATATGVATGLPANPWVAVPAATLDVAATLKIEVLGSVRKVQTGRIGAMTGWRPAWQSVTNSRMQLGS